MTKTYAPPERKQHVRYLSVSGAGTKENGGPTDHGETPAVNAPGVGSVLL